MYRHAIARDLAKQLPDRNSGGIVPPGYWSSDPQSGRAQRLLRRIVFSVWISVQLLHTPRPGSPPKSIHTSFSSLTCTMAGISQKFTFLYIFLIHILPDKPECLIYDTRFRVVRVPKLLQFPKQGRSIRPVFLMKTVLSYSSKTGTCSHRFSTLFWKLPQLRHSNGPAYASYIRHSGLPG